MLHAFAFLQVSVLYICLLFSHASRVIDIARLAQDGQNRVQAHRTVVSDFRYEPSYEGSSLSQRKASSLLLCRVYARTAQDRQSFEQYQEFT